MNKLEIEEIVEKINYTLKQFVVARCTTEQFKLEISTAIFKLSQEPDPILRFPTSWTLTMYSGEKKIEFPQKLEVVENSDLEDSVFKIHCVENSDSEDSVFKMPYLNCDI